MNAPLELFDLSHRDARALLAEGVPVYLSINPVEYHGPHLPLHNDALVSAGLARDLHARLVARRGVEWPFVVARDLEIGVDPTPGPGSRHTPFAVARGLIREACRALAELGAKRVVFATFHGAPLHGVAIEAGVELLAGRGVAAVNPFNGLMRAIRDVSEDGKVTLGDDLVDLAPAYAHVDDPAERRAMLRAASIDFHAGFLETSLTLHYAPGSVSPLHRALPPCPPIVPDRTFERASRLARRAGAIALANDLTLAAYGTGWHAVDPFPGYTGSPHRATAEAGAYFASLAATQYARLVDDVFAGRAASPKPVLGWTSTLTLNGRLAPKPPSMRFVS